MLARAYADVERLIDRGSIATPTLRSLGICAGARGTLHLGAACSLVGRSSGIGSLPPGRVDHPPRPAPSFLDSAAGLVTGEIGSEPTEGPEVSAGGGRSSSTRPTASHRACYRWPVGSERPLFLNGSVLIRAGGKCMVCLVKWEHVMGRDVFHPRSVRDWMSVVVKYGL